MIRSIVRDQAFLSQISAEATAQDVETAQDLLDTLAANKDRCVGMAANMIGVCKRIIAFEDGGKYAVMYNPQIVKRQDVYETQEGCLSLDGMRPAKRYKSIKVQYQNERMQIRYKTYSGFTAQIVQHEIDHLNGIII